MKFYDWAQSTNNCVTATYIPGIFNIETDKESRVQKDRAKWMLSKTVFDDNAMQLDFNPIFTYLLPV